MKTFKEFIESRADIIDPKRKPDAPPFERLGNIYPGDDDYDPKAVKDAEFFDTDDPLLKRSEKGITAQYPLARKTPGSGFQEKTPEQMFSKPSTYSDSASKREFIDTLRSKLYTNEPMSQKELDILGRMLDKEYEKTFTP